jgi:hypothetical protein
VAIANSVVTVRQFLAVPRVPSAFSARAASFEVPKPSGA